MTTPLHLHPGRVTMGLVAGDDLAFDVTVTDGTDPIDLSSGTWECVVGTASVTVDTADTATGELHITVPAATATTLAAAGKASNWYLRDSAAKRTYVNGPVLIGAPGTAGLGTAGTTSLPLTLTAAADTITITAAAVTLGAGGTVTSGAGTPSSTPSAVGDIYIDTTGDNAYIAAGTASSADWKQATGAGGGDLLAANNLSDVASAPTARTNLGLEIGTDVQAHDADLDALAALTAPATKLAGIEDSADVTDATNVDAAGAVMEADYNANTILAATSDDTPVALTVAEQTLVGRITAGAIAALTATQVRTLLNVEAGADVTDAANVDAAGAVMTTDADLTGYGWFLDDDTFAADSAIKVPSQQSVKAQIATQIAAVIASAPGALDTLDELAAAMGDDANFATTITNALALKAAIADVVLAALYDANTIVKADSDNTPTAMVVGEQTLVGRITAGSIAALTPTQVRTLLGIEAGATADQSAGEILAGLLDVDGDASELDADLLDGNHATAFATAAQGTTADAALPRAGGTMTGALVLEEVRETLVTANSGDAYEIDVTAGTHFKITNTATTACTLTITGFTTGKAMSVDVELVHATGKTWTLPAGWAWSGGTAATLSSGAGARDRLVVGSVDGGTTVDAFAAGLDMS